MSTEMEIIQTLPIEIANLNKNLSFSNLPPISEFNSSNIEDDIKKTVESVSIIYKYLIEESKSRQKIQEDRNSVSSDLSLCKSMLDTLQKEKEILTSQVKELHFQNQNLESIMKTQK